jgi:hypothetical protein
LLFGGDSFLVAALSRTDSQSKGLKMAIFAQAKRNMLRSVAENVKL